MTLGLQVRASGSRELSSVGRVNVRKSTPSTNSMVKNH